MKESVIESNFIKIEIIKYILIFKKIMRNICLLYFKL